MAITVRCSCGKKNIVADALAGASIRCPACGNNLAVGAPAAGAQSAAAARQKAAAGPAVSINPTILISATVGVLLLVTVLTLYFGPWRVGSDWADMKPKANTDVTDVVNFALQAYESQNGMYDSSQSHMVPHVEGDANFIPPAMAFHMPPRIIFTGKTNQGNYRGTWNTTTGEIIADIEVGGYTIGGLVDAKKATDSFHITGRKKGADVSAECDDKPLKMVFRKAHTKRDD